MHHKNAINKSTLIDGALALHMAVRQLIAVPRFGIQLHNDIKDRHGGGDGSHAHLAMRVVEDSDAKPAKRMNLVDEHP